MTGHIILIRPHVLALNTSMANKASTSVLKAPGSMGAALVSTLRIRSGKRRKASSMRQSTRYSVFMARGWMKGFNLIVVMIKWVLEK